MSTFFPAAALAGAACWILSELIEVSGGGFSALSLGLTTLAFAALSVGVWGLDGERPTTRAWTAATGVGSLGFALMAAVAVDMGLSGGVQHEGPLFFAAVGTFALGVLALGGLSLATGRHPRWVGLGFTLAGLAGLVANAAELGLAANLSNGVLAGFLAAMAAPHFTPALAAPPAP